MPDIIKAHLTWLRAGGASTDTIEDREGLLGRLDRALPFGVEQALTEELQDWLSDARWSQATRATYYNHIMAFYRWACDRNKSIYIDENPSLALYPVKHPDGVPRPWTDDELAKLLRDAGEPWHICVRLAAFAGLRCYEMAGLDREGVTEESLRVYGKGRKTRVVGTHPEIWRVVRDLPAGPLVRRQDGARVTPNAISSRAGTHFRSLGLHVTLHQGRHWFATRQLDSGASIRVVQENLGHSSLGSTQRYTRVADSARNAAVVALPVPS